MLDGLVSRYGGRRETVLGRFLPRDGAAGRARRARNGGTRGVVQRRRGIFTSVIICAICTFTGARGAAPTVGQTWVAGYNRRHGTGEEL